MSRKRVIRKQRRSQQWVVTSLLANRNDIFAPSSYVQSAAKGRNSCTKGEKREGDGRGLDLASKDLN